MTFGPISFGNVVSVSTIVQLNAGDEVEIYAQSSIDGVLSPLEDGAHFEAARFPSPIKSLNNEFAEAKPSPKW